MFRKSCEGLYGPYDEFGPDDPVVDLSLCAVAMFSFAIVMFLGKTI